MSLPLPAITHPGLALASTSTHRPGPGTHIFASQIISSLSGRPMILPPASSSEKGSSKPIISVPRLVPSHTTHASAIPSSNVSNINTLPKVGDVVLARVTRVRVRQIDVGILCVGENPSNTGHVAAADGSLGGKKGDAAATTPPSYAVNADTYPGTIRREDVRATEKEKVVTSEGFRVGDLVRAVVISLGDQANYYLSTARNEFGVLMARSEDGNGMVPISWREFRDERTGRREGRKVAKPF